MLIDVSVASTMTSSAGALTAAAAASTPCTTMAMVSRLIMRRTRSTRSAITPPNALDSRAERNRAIDAAATHAGECVALNT